jgi:FixJ family two-component response regulator
MRPDADQHAILGSNTVKTGMDVEPIVVVVDDDAPMRAALKRVFTAARFTVDSYASGPELLDKCDFGRHSVLLLDVMMPGMSGLELQRALRTRGVNLPVIFLTGSGDIPMAVEAMHDGAIDFLEKPFDNAELVDRVRRAWARPVVHAHTANFDPDFARRKASLTPRELEVMEEVITGKTNKVVARDLGASFRTIEIHRARVMIKMQADTLADLVRMALESDLGE